MSIPTLNDIFGADTSVLSFLNLDMLQKFKVGYFMALLAWYDTPVWQIGARCLVANVRLCPGV